MGMNRWDFMGNKRARYVQANSEASEARCLVAWLLAERCGLDAVRAGLVMTLGPTTVARLRDRARSRMRTDLLFENRAKRAEMLAGGEDA